MCDLHQLFVSSASPRRLYITWPTLSSPPFDCGIKRIKFRGRTEGEEEEEKYCQTDAKGKTPDHPASLSVWLDADAMASPAPQQADLLSSSTYDKTMQLLSNWTFFLLTRRVNKPHCSIEYYKLQYPCTLQTSVQIYAL